MIIKKCLWAGLLSVSFTAFTAFTAFAATSNVAEPILFKAVFSSDDIAHPLYQSDSKNIPHPFYKKMCEASTPIEGAKATGEAIFSFDPKRHTLQYAIAYEGLSGDLLMAHFHFASAKQEGPIVQTICGEPPKNNPVLGFSARQLDGQSCPKGPSGFITGSYVLGGNPKLNMTESEEVDALMKGDIYINFHTCLNELGEVRAQLVRMA